MNKPKQTGNRSATNGNNSRAGRNSKKPHNNRGQRSDKDGLKTAKPRPKTTAQARNASRGEAIRASRRNHDDANKAIGRWNIFEKHHEKSSEINPLRQKDRLRITFLGGLEGIGEKNMLVMEYDQDAIIVDCGFDLSVDLPGINYAIPATQYVDSIKHKIKAYAITHGHMDHIAALPYVYQKHPAPIYCASHFTAEMIKKQFENINLNDGVDIEPNIVVMAMDNHETNQITPNFIIEYARITHSIPDCSLLIIKTPVGNVVNTGDFRLDPEPLDNFPTDIARLKDLGKEGKTLLLLSDSTGARKLGRTPTEHSLQQTFHDIFQQSRGRIFVAIFSTNMNRVQMIINSASEAGRKVAFDGRGMMQVSEIAIRTGNLRIPKGSVVPLREVPNIKDDQVVIVCTGGQGEPNAALQRMSIGEHKYIKLKQEDTVIISSSPIPGNEVRYQQIGNDLAEIGVSLFRQVTHELDGCGPLHVSGHANQDELSEMVEMTQPKYLLPIHGGMLDRTYHGRAGVNAGLPKGNVILPKNGSMVEFDKDGKYHDAGSAPAGGVLVDQTGAVVNGVVIKDRVMLSEEGLVTVILTVDKRTGQLLTSPDIISRGFIYMRDSEELMNLFRTELRRAVTQRFKRVDLDRFKAELKDYITHFLYEQTQRSPIVIPVINVISVKSGSGGKQANGKKDGASKDKPSEKTSEQIAAEQQERFAALRQQLLGQDARND